MNAQKILFPTDFSSSSEAALGLATTLARDCGGKLLIMHVEELLPATGGAEFIYSIPERPTEELREKLNEVLPTDPQVPYEHILLSGDAADEIVRTAESENCDMIVIGTHGRRGLTRLLMGSVAEAVVRRAKCPVLTVKQPADEPVKTA